MLGVCAGLILGYLVGMNGFLGTRWFRSAINFSPDQIRVEYARAYSIWPGRIHVDGLSIRGSDGAVQWILRIDVCDFRVQFLDLLHRQFHATHVRGSGLSMRIRMRLEPTEVDPRVVAALPPVPGFSDPPYLETGPPTPPLTDATYKLWSVRLDDVDAQHVHEIWVHTLRYAGDLRVRGRWVFRPLRWLEIGPAAIDIETLDVSYGLTSPLLAGLHGSVAATVHPFDLRKADGLKILRYVSANTDVQGSADTAELTRAWGPSPLWRVEQGEGPIDLGLRVETGVLRSGSRATMSSEEAHVVVANRSLRAGVAAEMHVDGDPPVAQLAVQVSSLSIARRGVDVGGARAISLRLTSPDVDLANPSVEAASFAVELKGAHAPTVAFLGPLLPTGVMADSGAVRAEAHLEGRLDDSTARGQVGFSIRDLSVARGANRIGANVQATIRIESGSLRDGEVDLTDSDVDLADGVASVGGLRVQAPTLALHAKRAVIQRGVPPDLDVDLDLPEASVTNLRDLNALWSGGIRVAGGRARVSGKASLRLRDRVVSATARIATEGLVLRLGGPLAVSCRLTARASTARWNWGPRLVDLSSAEVILRDVSLMAPGGEPGLMTAPVVFVRAPRLALGPQGKSGTISVDLPAAEIADIAALTGSLNLSKAVKITRGEASASMHVRADVSSLSAAGTTDLVARNLRVQVGTDTYQGELDVALRADNRGVDPNMTVLSGSTLAFTSRATPSTEAWWARVSLRDAGLQLAGETRFRATVHVTAENASPVQALLARVTAVPRWALDAFPTEDLHADGEIRETPSSLELRSVVARSRGTLVRLEYAKHDADKEGMVLVSSGSLRLGFTIAGDGPKFLLFGAESWFARQAAALRTHERSVGRSFREEPTGFGKMRGSVEAATRRPTPPP